MTIEKSHILFDWSLFHFVSYSLFVNETQMKKRNLPTILTKEWDIQEICLSEWTTEHIKFSLQNIEPPQWVVYKHKNFFFI